ncbi:MAG: alpha/beta fold hydrolase, partial [Gemmatimonadales bacterium]
MLEDTVRVNGVELYVRTVGEGPDVVVLHGGPGAHHDYLLPHFDALAVGRRLRYYDQRGGGRSPVPRDVPVGWREHVADLDALVAHWDIVPATILGYSWGALLALLYAATHSDRVDRLALVSPAPLDHEHRAEFQRRFAERMDDAKVRKAREALRRS